MTDEKNPPGNPPCPGCGAVGEASEWYAGEDRVQLWECTEADETCRVWSYRRRECDPQDDFTGDADD